MISKIISVHDVASAGIDPDYFPAAVSQSSSQVQALHWNDEHDLLTIAFDGSGRELEQLLERVIENIGKEVAGCRAKLLFANAAGRHPEKLNIWNQLVQSEMVKDFGNGHIAYGALFLELVEEFDKSLHRIAVEAGAKAIHFPNCIPLAYLKRMGSLDQYPHYFFFVSPLRSDVEGITELQTTQTVSGAHLRKQLADTEYCLKTSACCLLYPMLENANFQDHSFYTMVGSCTRNEGPTVSSLERLTEFRMREIVFVGDETGADQFQAFGIGLFRDLIESFDLTARVITANDSFFVSNYGALKLMQLLGNDKFEARLLIPDSNTEIAVSSFNHHRHFFGRRFGISFRGETASTACIGFGLERLIYGILSQCGLDRQRTLDNLARFLELRARPNQLSPA